jgi:glutathione synthase/RimK-type ligase-like ATP-grasp enzyme
VPPVVLDMALAAARAIGDGLYGVDLKQFENQCRVIEVNDNPNIDAGIEDEILKDELYRRVMEYFLRRCEARTQQRERL